MVGPVGLQPGPATLARATLGLHGSEPVLELSGGPPASSPPGLAGRGVGQRAGVGDLASPGGTIKTSAAAWANLGGPAPSSGESRWPHFWAPASRWREPKADQDWSRPLTLGWWDVWPVLAVALVRGRLACWLLSQALFSGAQLTRLGCLSSCTGQRLVALAHQLTTPGQQPLRP